MLTLRDILFYVLVLAIYVVMLFTVCTNNASRLELETTEYKVRIVTQKVVDSTNKIEYDCYVAVVDMKIAALLECERAQ